MEESIVAPIVLRVGRLEGLDAGCKHAIYMVDSWYTGVILTLRPGKVGMIFVYPMEWEILGFQN